MNIQGWFPLEIPRGWLMGPQRSLHKMPPGCGRHTSKRTVCLPREYVCVQNCIAQHNCCTEREITASASRSSLLTLFPVCPSLQEQLLCLFQSQLNAYFAKEEHRPATAIWSKSQFILEQKMKISGVISPRELKAEGWHFNDAYIFNEFLSKEVCF